MSGPSSDRGNDALKRHLRHFLQKRDPPKTFCPSEVARSLTAEELSALQCEGWRDAMPAVRQIAWEMQAKGECEVVQKGEPVGDVGPEDVKGPIRIRRAAG